jgi:RimJ/RimL family protein N-acetyltransferase
MIAGSNISLRPIGDEDWPKFEEWGMSREALWGPYQRLQLDHLPLLREAYQQTGLLKRESGMLIIETKKDRHVVGFVRYGMLRIADADLPCPEIGFGIPEVAARGRGFAQEGVKLLVEYLFAGYPVERVTAFTDEENRAAQRVMESVGFQREGILRRATFRDGLWRDIALYGILRHEVGVQDPDRKNTLRDGNEERSTMR